MMRNTGMGFWAVVVAAAMAVAAGCSSSNGGTAGGETHWLLACTSDEACGPDAVCRCSVCTKECDDEAQCATAGELTACAPPTSAGVSALCATTVGRGLCLGECTGDEDCARIGVALTCAGGHCVPRTDPLACTDSTGCPPSASCVDGQCRCDATPTCLPGQTLRCIPTHDMQLNCLECECVGDPIDAGASDAGADGHAGGDAGGELIWYTTCGDPVCSGHRDSGVPHCSPVPTEGEHCTESGEMCDPISDCNSLFACATEDPKLGAGGCPISRRRYKEDIQYLTEGDVAAAHDALMSLPLATYRYRTGDGRPHLGFIIEDIPTGAISNVAVDAERNMVDLYGYASMAVAALKVQNARIAALEAELAALKAALPADERDRAAICLP